MPPKSDISSVGGRSSPRFGNKTDKDYSNINIDQIVEMFTTLQEQNTEILGKLDCIENIKSDIVQIKEENSALKSRVCLLEEDNCRLDQYMRKNVMIVSGLSFETTETSEELQQKILGMLNTIYRPTGLVLDFRDLIACHRNGRKGNGNRPPSVTVKFVRYMDKDRLFTRQFVALRKKEFRGVNFHHNLCKRLIHEQKLINEHSNLVKFSFFAGDNKFFSVCISGNHEDKFLNFIRNYKHFVLEYDRLMKN